MFQTFLDNYEKKKENLLKITIFYVTGIISGLAIVFFVDRYDRNEARKAGRRIVDWEDVPPKPTAPLDYNDPETYEPKPFLRWNFNEDMGYPSLGDSSDDDAVAKVTPREAAERYGFRADDFQTADKTYNKDTADKHMVMSWNFLDDLDKLKHSLSTK